MNRKQLNHRIRAFAHGTLGMDVEAYRGVIRDVVPRNVEHITQCTDAEAELVLTALRRFQEGRPKEPGRPPTRKGLPARTTAVRSGGERQHSMIPRLMDFLRWDWRSTARFCEKITGKTDTRRCDAKELSKVIRGMIAIIGQNISSGKLQLTHTELFEFHRHTQSKYNHSPLREGNASFSERSSL